MAGSFKPTKSPSLRALMEVAQSIEDKPIPILQCRLHLRPTLSLLSPRNVSVLNSRPCSHGRSPPGEFAAPRPLRTRGPATVLPAALASDLAVLRLHSRRAKGEISPSPTASCFGLEESLGKLWFPYSCSLFQFKLLGFNTPFQAVQQMRCAYFGPCPPTTTPHFKGFSPERRSARQTSSPPDKRCIPSGP